MDTPPGELADANETGMGLYVHWPFCLAKCPYCDFNSHVREAIDQARWRQAYLAELEHVAASTPSRRLESIFFGGGTPSLMEPETVAAIIERAFALWPSAPGCEVTLEANPTSVEAKRFEAFNDAGVNRLSIGIQSLNDDALRFLGRTHGRDEAVAALECAQRHFPRHSFDLIYALPGQSAKSWRAELIEALALGASHISAYQLTIERGTPFFGAHRRGVIKLPNEDLGARLYETTLAALEGAGLFAYEVSNHARPGEECRHNLRYWRYGDYAAIGPGAHGRLSIGEDTVAIKKLRSPERWIGAVESEGHGSESETRLSPGERIEEIVLMGLRLKEGIGRARFRHQTGGDFTDILGPEKLERLTAAGFLTLDDETLKATNSGRARLNAVVLELLG
ncbi:MAG: coproporphyrinogen III oxidase [Proteobacteria bacterium]|nr:coproporphyrinogen III oxidase [Pseudomonadota bacterium]